MCVRGRAGDRGEEDVDDDEAAADASDEAGDEATGDEAEEADGTDEDDADKR